MEKFILRMVCLLLFLNIVPAYSQTNNSSVKLLQSIEQIKKERILAQDQFHIIQSKISAPGAKPSLDELKQYTEAVIRIRNLRYSFGLDSNYVRVYFRRTNNKTQNKLGEEEYLKTYGDLIGYDLKTEPPFSTKDINQASLCLRSMFKLASLDVVLNTNFDHSIQMSIKSE